MTERDPRTDPRPGDVLTKDGKKGQLRRTVDRVVPVGKDAFEVYYNGKSRSTWSETWKNWARNASVANPSSGRPGWAKQPNPAMELVAVASCIEGWASNLSMGVSDTKKAAKKIQEACTRLVELADYMKESQWTPS